MINAKDWKWSGLAHHLIGGANCRFHMATQIGNVIISTVGEYWLDKASMEKLGEEGPLEIGLGRTFETFVFKASDNLCTCGCGLNLIHDYTEIDSLAANTRAEATENHMKLCVKWAEADGDPKLEKLAE